MAIKTNPLTAVAYLRVSTTDQSLGIEAQKASIDQWSASNGIQVVAFFQDVGISGSAPIEARVGLLRAIAEQKAQKCGVLIAAKRDRFARDVLVIQLLEKLIRASGAVLRTADCSSESESPESSLLKGIMDVFSQFELSVIRSRTRSALASKKARNERTGKLPYGKKLSSDGKTLIDDSVELEIINRVRSLRELGVTIQGIVNELDSNGIISPRSGRPYRASQIFNMLKLTIPRIEAA